MSLKKKDYYRAALAEVLQQSGELSLKRIQEIINSADTGQDMESFLEKTISAEEYLEYKSQLLGITRISLPQRTIDYNTLRLISEELAIKYNTIPLKIQDGRLLMAMSDPMNRAALDDLSMYTGLAVEPLLAGKEEIKTAIREYYTVDRSAAEFSSDPVRPVSVWKVEENIQGQEAPIISIVDSFLKQAIKESASDIHWEPGEQGLKVKFRVDGLLMVKAVLPLGITRGVAARLKVMAGMDVTERRFPQDGRIMLELPGKKIDIRLSTFCTVYGEKIVARILDAETAQRSLAELGLREEIEEGVRRLLRQPYGLILVTGPTGSGKTTTLYALLQELQSETLNVVSIEDPVEYRLPGVNQAQVNAKIGLDFAGGLRAILRQDPDIIMVGEIRDQETAQIATAAALTGHLVLSTLHTNSAAEALARLLDMGIEPYLVGSAVCGVLAQRLVRKLCSYCRQIRPILPTESEALAWEYEGDIFVVQGCSKCRGTGYLGRIGIHEYLPYDSVMKELVLQKSSAARMEQKCRSSGMLTLREDALMKVTKGLTSLEEVMRISAGV